MSDIGGPHGRWRHTAAKTILSICSRAGWRKPKRSEPNEPNAMALATVDALGRPNIRMVLLKGWDADGFVFYSNKESRQGLGNFLPSPCRSVPALEVAAPPNPGARRGVSEVGAAEADAYFASRPKDSQIGAWARAQSRPMESRFHFEKEIAKVRRQIRHAAKCRGRITGPAFASRRWRSNSGATSRSACMTGWSIAATESASPWTTEEAVSVSGSSC